MASIDQEYYADQYVYLDRAVLPANARVLLGDDVGANVDGERWVVFSDVAAVPD